MPLTLYLVIRPFGGSGLLHVKTTLSITQVLVVLKLRGAEGTVIRLIVHSLDAYRHMYVYVTSYAKIRHLCTVWQRTVFIVNG